ncbi:glycerol-3-phosphate responsive antiterminator [Paenibacillus sediminis]|uniref:Glycerol uptake operon antiterminator regulatory protein n=1 Tax=Paenibacillus sediminis TaxID=664909 RepID=A0ABS4H325_9BACL|nr:glycerol-3-phosphate responsive antiterminator [Paenibacillus sediminis]MBP1936777.1 glycerol uptake operon antiterminator [Paenibacillus sediminis]
MAAFNQRIFPAARHLKDVEYLTESKYEYIILLDSHISQLSSVAQMVRSRQKKLIIHLDLINGLKNDEYATEYICQVVRPAGIISTRNNAIITAKKNKMLSIQRHFILDSMALETSLKLTEKTKPDYIEILPGIMPQIITELTAKIDVPILAGGLIRTIEEVESALQAGAIAVTTSNKEIWKYYE